MSTTAEQVEHLLATYQRCRDSDTELIIGVLHLKGLHLDEQQRDIVRSVNFESIRRDRQKLQEAGLYQPSPEVAKRRRLKAKKIQGQAKDASAERMQELITSQ